MRGSHERGQLKNGREGAPLCPKIKQKLNARHGRAQIMKKEKKRPYLNVLDWRFKTMEYRERKISNGDRMGDLEVGYFLGAP